MRRITGGLGRRSAELRTNDLMDSVLRREEKILGVRADDLGDLVLRIDEKILGRKRPMELHLAQHLITGTMSFPMLYAFERASWGLFFWRSRVNEGRQEAGLWGSIGLTSKDKLPSQEGNTKFHCLLAEQLCSIYYGMSRHYIADKM
ncbi:hypothetical protein SADUNF_Sadunf01G0018400 [Salix dunnii]|uniref:Uncharacterized protein n=1 Tax=Salix dunnii TaxID=1413687 RepID=A0A835N9U6_9ROSI|nr:hypothetical protein SADUNF_Sadunf01G0018400 [Salix dunnii]